MDFVSILAKEFSLKPEHVRAVIEMLDAGNTIPFIARSFCASWRSAWNTCGTWKSAGRKSKRP